MTHGSLSPLTAPTTNHQEPFLQKLFSRHSVPGCLSDSKAKLVHYISSLSLTPLFLTQSLFMLPCLLGFDSIAILKFVQGSESGFVLLFDKV